MHRAENHTICSPPRRSDGSARTCRAGSTSSHETPKRSNAEVVPHEPWIDAPATSLSSLRAIISISTDLLDTALVAAVTERFEETADVMRESVAQYRNADDDAVEQLAATYLSATGTWTTSSDT